MRKLFTLILFCTLTNLIFAQEDRDRLDKITDSLEREGKLLHSSEWTSWYGTDIFLAKCPDKKALSGGYLSYDTGKGWNNIFFTKGDNPMVLATTSFSYDFNKDNYTFDTTVRKLTLIENSLFIIRHIAVIDMEKDTIFKYYRNSSLNPIPVIENGVKKVYVLTGPNVNGVVVFGNDYLFYFNKDNTIVQVKKLHKNIIVTETRDTTQVSGFHTHLSSTGDFITSTDICTLMLYEKFTRWQNYFVMSQNYVSLWDCKKDQLVILTKEAWQKIVNDHAERNKAAPAKN
jgi:hypothetical protein